MKRIEAFVFFVFCGVVSLRASSFTQVATFPVNPDGTFLYQAPQDNCNESYAASTCGSMSPLVINLAAIGLASGDVIQLTQGGTFCPYQQPYCGLENAFLMGVFSGDDIVLSSSNLDRVPGAISAGLPDVPTIAFLNGTVNTLPGDFWLSVTVTIPAGANFLDVAQMDSSYSDNTGLESVTISKEVPVAPVPEPASVAIALFGFAALFLVHRRRLI